MMVRVRALRCVCVFFFAAATQSMHISLCVVFSGRVVIWDFDTRGVIRSLLGHVQPITAVG